MSFSTQSELTMPVPLARIAKMLDRSVSTVWKWRKIGRKNPHTDERVFPEFTWLPTGQWGMTQQQFDTFIELLNEKP